MGATLKTGYIIQCEDDFVEHDGAMRELTVTITLHEYRALITENVQFAADIDAYKKEVENLTDKNEKLSQAILACNVDKMIRDIGKAIGNAFAQSKEETEDGDNESDT